MALLKAAIESKFLIEAGDICHILGPRKDTVSVPLYTECTDGVVNCKGFRRA